MYSVAVANTWCITCLSEGKTISVKLDDRIETRLRIFLTGDGECLEVALLFRGDSDRRKLLRGLRLGLLRGERRGLSLRGLLRELDLCGLRRGLLHNKLNKLINNWRRQLKFKMFIIWKKSTSAFLTIASAFPFPSLFLVLCPSLLFRVPSPFPSLFLSHALETDDGVPSLSHGPSRVPAPCHGLGPADPYPDHGLCHHLADGTSGVSLYGPGTSKAKQISISTVIGSKKHDSATLIQTLVKLTLLVERPLSESDPEESLLFER